MATDLSHRSPPPRETAHNLPAQATTCVGREQERAAVRALLDRGRLVTLVGTGGVGKTLLALTVGADIAHQYPEGVWVVELAPLAGGGPGDALPVPETVAEALGVHEEPDRPALDTVVGYLGEKRLLLVLDNCEHLLAACAELVGAVLRACPGVRVLATSREPLRLPAERRFAVPPLALPAADAAGPEAAAAAPAVALFVVRAQAVEPSFALDAGNAAAVAAICRRLDGLPLALELAAVRLKTRTPAALLDELAERLRALGGGGRRREARQRTIHALLDWSYALLSPGEQALFARLSVFGAGGWTLEAAQAVCVLDDDLPFPAAEGLASLVEKSLVRPPDAVGRSGMLETVREYAGYALARLAAAEDEAAVRRRHAEYYLALAEEAEPRLAGPEQVGWLDRLEREHDNLRAALAWSLDGEAAALGVQLAGALWRFWEVRGHLREGQAWLARAVERGRDATTAAHARALNGAGNLARNRGEYEPARALFEESLVLRRALGDRHGVAVALSNLGSVAGCLGEQEQARSLFEEGLALTHALGDHEGITIALNNLGVVASRQGQFERAYALFEESLALARDLGDQDGIAFLLSNLASAAREQGRYEQARALLKESLVLNGEVGDTWGIAYSLEELALLASTQQQHRRAATLFAAAGGLRETIGIPVPTDERDEHERVLAAVREGLGAEEFAAAWAVGLALAPADAIALALADAPDAGEGRHGSPRQGGS